LWLHKQFPAQSILMPRPLFVVQGAPMTLPPYCGCSSRTIIRSLIEVSALNSLVFGVALGEEALNQSAASVPAASRTPPLLRKPIWVYNNWSAYDELSDRIPLTEELAMRELSAIERLRRFGVRFDYYVMDAFWFTPGGAYREWRKPNWPNGPDRWIAECRRNGILPGLWFSTNTLVKIDAAPAWNDSLNSRKGAMSFYEGGFLSDFMDILQYWYDRGIRMYKFDFADFSAATPRAEQNQSPETIRSRNEAAFREALRKFRHKNPDVVLEAFNGFGGDVDSTAGPFPFTHPIDTRWLEVFDGMYSGDPRPSDVPQMNFWRSMDIYSDHMVRRYEQSSIPLDRIDSTGFMIGNTGTNYYRKTSAWKGMLLLMAARGGWINTVYGNLEFLDDESARWFAMIQSMYAPLQAAGHTKTFGGVPGDLQPYGFVSFDSHGAIYNVVNPAQSFQVIQLPNTSGAKAPSNDGRILFRDAGFVAALSDYTITLGPGQMATVGYGRYADRHFDLGIQDDVRIPISIAPLAARFESAGTNTIAATVRPPVKKDVRIVLEQRGSNGKIRRSWPGGPPDGKSVGKVLVLRATQNKNELPIEIDYDRVIWSGLSWAAGEIRHTAFSGGEPITIRCSSAEKEPMSLEANVFAVEYAK
jgi:hypothetical protein